MISSILSGVLFRVGGTDQWVFPLNQKWWRWMIGLPLGILWCLYLHSFLPLLMIPMYYVATAVFKYGEKSWLNFLGEDGKFVVCGVVLGLAGAPVLLWWAILQGVISGAGWYGIKVLDDRGVLKNPWVEFGRGFVGTIGLGLVELLWLMRLFRYIET